MATAAFHSTPFQVAVSPIPDRGYLRELRTSIQDAVQRGTRLVSVDCGGWQHLDLLVLSALVRSAHECATEGADFELTNVGHELRSNIEALRLSRRLGLQQE